MAFTKPLRLNSPAARLATVPSTVPLPPLSAHSGGPRSCLTRRHAGSGASRRHVLGSGAAAAKAGGAGGALLGAGRVYRLHATPARAAGAARSPRRGQSAVISWLRIRLD